MSLGGCVRAEEPGQQVQLIWAVPWVNHLFGILGLCSLLPSGDFQFNLEISADARCKPPSLLILLAQSRLSQLAACNRRVLLSRLLQL